VKLMTNDLHLSLLASPSAAGLARTLITQRLTKWGYQHLTDDASPWSSRRGFVRKVAHAVHFRTKLVGGGWAVRCGG
jgi:hypothetical protein